MELKQIPQQMILVRCVSKSRTKNAVLTNNSALEDATDNKCEGASTIARYTPLVPAEIMDSDDISFDAALLEQVAAFLQTGDSFLPLAGSGSDTDRSADAEAYFSASSLCASSTNCFMDGRSDPRRSSNTRDSTAALKRKARREKEALRKQRYQRRLKHERETLQRMEIVLNKRLLQMKQAHEAKMDGSVVHTDSVVRDSAIQEREGRLRAEQEQKRLLEVVTTQATYLATLQDFLPDQTLSTIETYANTAPTRDGKKQSADAFYNIDFVV
ncbi:hypothetical protein PHYPSEUDO_002080 [Phytophthora pseudosyringae]|uniref:Uncharacterized protein n=1 Tax=Phytophthora pseudosyringae TaxID=221518 RepID=A0A8T1VZ91_9STRA|nr:hypothetical protein PHYPSEUDO_002080 [Phytophthora pseudosyringae]